jgi:hypothetical protein
VGCRLHPEQDDQNREDDKRVGSSQGNVNELKHIQPLISKVRTDYFMDVMNLPVTPPDLHRRMWTEPKVSQLDRWIGEKPVFAPSTPCGITQSIKLCRCANNAMARNYADFPMNMPRALVYHKAETEYRDWY